MNYFWICLGQFFQNKLVFEARRYFEWVNASTGALKMQLRGSFFPGPRFPQHPFEVLRVTEAECTALDVLNNDTPAFERSIGLPAVPVQVLLQRFCKPLPLVNTTSHHPAAKPKETGLSFIPRDALVVNVRKSLPNAVRHVDV